MKRFRWLIVLCVVAVAAAACGRSDDKSGCRDVDHVAGREHRRRPRLDGRVRHERRRVQARATRRARPTRASRRPRSRSARSPTPGSPAGPASTRSCSTPPPCSPKWCNAAGGINGRKIVNNLRDAALFNVKARMTEACAEDFMLVGGGVVFDQDGVNTRLELRDARDRRLRGEPAGAGRRPADPAASRTPRRRCRSATTSTSSRSTPTATKAYGVLTGDVDTTKIVARSRPTRRCRRSGGRRSTTTSTRPPARATGRRTRRRSRTTAPRA